MKILVIGLAGATPELLFGDERLQNIRRLMEQGCYGRLESVIPPHAVPAWMCMTTSQDPGSLGVYGFRDRADYSYNSLRPVDARSITEPALWDQVARAGGKSVILGVPPGYPPRQVNGIFVGCFLTPDTSKCVYTHPAEIARQIEKLVGDYPVDVRDFRCPDKSRLRDEIHAMGRKHFTVVRHFLEHAEWDYFQFVEIGLDRIQRGFWKDHDPQHVRHEPDSPYRDVIRDYYVYLDEEIGRLLELLTDDTIVLVISALGAQRLQGGFWINEWLVREGLLVPDRYPEQITPLEKLDIDWSQTRVWGEGGDSARLYFNVKDREPAGVIEPADYERFRDEIKARLEATTDAKGQPLGTLVFKPEEIHRTVRGVAPDLIVHFGGLAWRAIGAVGHAGLHSLENDTGLDDCNPAPFGAFVLAASHNPLQGPIEGVHLLDIAPTLLELGGYERLPSMQGRSLVAGLVAEPGADDGLVDEERIVRDRLSGLGYLG
jgi:predicted AlkP superfamily phosphohydrolase/phosphomutase